MDDSRIWKNVEGARNRRLSVDTLFVDFYFRYAIWVTFKESLVNNKRKIRKTSHECVRSERTQGEQVYECRSTRIDLFLLSMDLQTYFWLFKDSRTWTLVYVSRNWLSFSRKQIESISNRIYVYFLLLNLFR